MAWPRFEEGSCYESKSIAKYLQYLMDMETVYISVGLLADGLANSMLATLEWPLEPRGWTLFCPSSHLPLPCVCPQSEPRGDISRVASGGS
jgi:hypothetical protein